MPNGGRNDPRTAAENLTVSIVIPTRNAGSEFQDLLAMLKKQDGFGGIEIVVVDSSSTDDTAAIAQRYGAKLVPIRLEEFSHSFARNLGAEHASGDLLLFTVQDAFPPSTAWLREMFAPMKHHAVAAVSCAEYPREDADLFYRVMAWNHARFLEIDREDRIAGKPPGTDHASLRKNAQLTDVACLISRSLFLNYRHRGRYAEDLDLGLRLLGDGYRIALLGSTRIIHSHNRVPFDHLKRSYVETIALLRLLPAQPVSRVEPEDLAADILFGSHIVASLAGPLQRLALPVTVEELGRAVKEELRVLLAPGRVDPAQDSPHGVGGDPEFLKFMAQIREVRRAHAETTECRPGSVCASLANFVEIAFDYLSTAHEVVDSHVLDEFTASLPKALALQAGAHLGHCMVGASPRARRTLAPLDDLLSQGV